MGARRRRPHRFGPAPRHKHVEDRFHAPLEFREWLFIALAKHAVHLAARRRRRAGAKLESVAAVADRGEIWMQRRQQKVIALYLEQLQYLERPGSMSTKTLTRNVNALKARKLVTVDNYSRFDERRREWVQQPNVYIITRAGMLWINVAARGVKIPPVV